MFSLFLAACAAVIIIDEYRSNALKKSKMTWAVVETVNNEGKNAKSLDLYYFNEKNQKIELESIDPPAGCTGIIGDKDTIFIRYSLTDNGVIEIIECAWNERFRERMN